MTSSGDVVRAEVIIEVHPRIEPVEWDRAEWEAMTPAERELAVRVAGEAAIANAGGYGVRFLNPDDEP